MRATYQNSPFVSGLHKILSLSLQTPSSLLLELLSMTCMLSQVCFVTCGTCQSTFCQPLPVHCELTLLLQLVLSICISRLQNLNALSPRQGGTLRSNVHYLCEPGRISNREMLHHFRRNTSLSYQGVECNMLL